MSAHGSERRFDDVRSFSRSLGQAYVLQFATNPTLLTLTSHRGRSVSFVRIRSEICCRRANMRKLFHPVQAIQAKIKNLVAEYAVNEQTDKPCHTRLTSSTRLRTKSSPTRLATRHWKPPRARRGKFCFGRTILIRAVRAAISG
jgi:hypothetical protein